MTYDMNEARQRYMQNTLNQIGKDPVNRLTSIHSSPPVRNEAQIPIAIVIIWSTLNETAT